MSNLITIHGVRGFIDENGTAQLHIEDVARGLGFTTVATSGNDCVRWQRVRQYLNELKFSTSGETTFDEITQEQHKAELPDFIPENIFYRLAMKAKNQTAETFQAKVADEILPAIRKTGTYSVSPQIPQTLPEALRAYATEVENHIKAKALLEEQKPKVLYADATAGSKNSILIGELAKVLKQNGIEIGQNRLFEWLREHGYLIKQNGDNYNLPTQRSMDLGIMEIKNTAKLNPEGGSSIFRTTKITGKGRLYFVDKFLKAEKVEAI